MRTTLAVVVLCAIGLLPTTTLAQVQEYSPEDVYSSLQRAIRQSLNMPKFGPTETDPPMWFSLTNVGSVVDPKDIAQVYDLANFCPPASPVLPSFQREPKLDAVYERVINAMVGPVRDYSNDYYDALKVIGTVQDGIIVDESAKYKAYKLRQKEYVAALVKYITAKTPEERLTADLMKNTAEREWATFGYRGDIDKALNTIFAEEFRTGATRQRRRRDVLSSYRAAALEGKNIVSGESFAAPLSTFSPPPDKWEEEAGWFKVSFEMTAELQKESRETVSKSGFGGLSLGFITIGGSAGGTTTTEHKMNKASKLSYSFEVKRFTIRRDWMDGSVFFEPRAWTWRKSDAGEIFPRVALSMDNDRVPVEVDKNRSLYENQRIAFALLPVEGVIARNLKATATTSKSDYDEINQSGSAGGGGSLFGIFGGGGRRTYDIKEIEKTEGSVTFSVESKGISVIGLISQALPMTPDPNASDKWPANAWLPK